MADSSLYKMAHLCDLIARTPWPDILLGCVRDDPDGNRMVCRLLGTWVKDRLPHAGAPKENPARFTKGPRGAVAFVGAARSGRYPRLPTASG